MQYITKDREMLDWICWRYYGQQAKLTQSLLSIDPRLASKNSLLESQVSSLVQGQGNSLQGIIERVLDMNPGLVDYGPVLPAGITLQLPEIESQVGNNAAIRLWDE